jgi:DNA-binding HxlR family transcriptional regulator
MRAYEQYCGLARALDHVGSRWTLLIVRELLLGPKRFTDLRDGLPGVANNLLADRLRQLQDDGLVARRELPPPAASTVYELTEAGRELREAIDALIRWGGRWMLTGPQGDTFRGEWLALALDALGAARIEPGEIVEFDVDGDVVRLAVIDGQLSTTDETRRQPDLRVAADAATILGLAAGELTLVQARQAISIEPDTPEAHTTLVRILALTTHDSSGPGSGSG